MQTEFKQIKQATIQTLGCRLNQAESLLLKDQLESVGYEIIKNGIGVDLAIVNTCTVTREADTKCRKAIRKLIRENPNAFIAVIGCYSQTGSEIIASIEGVDLIIGNQDKLAVLDFAKEGKNEKPVIIRDKINKDDFSISFAGEYPYPKRANLKVQDGCDFMCTFCIIPFARGRARSRNFENAIEEAKSLVSRGVKELILSGVNIGTYENEGKTFLDIVDELNKIQGIERIRISSIEPTTIPLEMFDRMNDPEHALVPYLHLPLQSGCNKTLQNMRRKYSTEEYADFVKEAFKRVDGLCLGGDIMVGFPGETEEDFQESCKFFLDLPFSYCHVFPYSERDGTIVLKKDWESVPLPERQRRANALRRYSAKKRYDYMEQHLGKTVEVLFEDPREDTWPGLTQNFIRVVIKDERMLQNKLCKVKLTEIKADFMSGDVLEVLS